jgi:subtilisin family serine protease
MPSRSIRLLPIIVGSVLLGACVEQPTSPRNSSSVQLRPEASVVVSAARAGDVIPDRYLVLFRKNVKDAPGLARKLASDHAGALHHTFDHAVKGFAITLSEKELEKLERHPNVLLIEPDRIVTVVTTQTGATWGLDRVDQRDLPLTSTYNYTPTGANVRAYIIDTGIRTSHTDFGGRASVGFDALGGNGQDCNGHGTHVAGTVAGATYGIAKAARAIAVRVLDCNGSGSTSGVIAGIEWVTVNHIKPAVANMSLGGGLSTTLDNAVRSSIAAGVTYAIAAGNSNANACNTSPARVAEALTVGATTRTDARASFSNFGTCLDVFAPGASITSAWSSGNSATNTISGTSMAAPHVAGVAALYLEGNSAASAATVAAAIVNGATTGHVTSPGTGSPNRLLYSLLTGGGSPPPPPPPPPPTEPCTSCTRYSGSLSGANDSDYHPNGQYYYSASSGSHNGWLRGPSGTDFDLYLQKYTYFGWSNVAASYGSTSEESISYAGSAGYYRWLVDSYAGSGAYDFWLQRP